MFTIVYLWRIYIETKEYLLNPSYYIFYLSNTFKNRVTVSLVCFYAFQNLARILSFGTEDGRVPYRDHTLLLPSLICLFFSHSFTIAGKGGGILPGRAESDQYLIGEREFGSPLLYSIISS